MKIDSTTLWEYVDGQLPEEQRRLVEKALAAEPALAAELELIASLDQRLASQAEAELPESFGREVVRKYHAAKLAQANTAWWADWSSGGTLLLIMFAAFPLVLWVLFGGGFSQEALLAALGSLPLSTLVAYATVASAVGSVYYLILARQSRQRHKEVMHSIHSL